MPLLTRKRVIKIKIEGTKGTYEATDQAVYVEDLEINPTAPFVERGGPGLYRGHKEKGILGIMSGAVSFKKELQGNGSNGLELGLAILLQACGLKKTAEVYQVHSTHADDETITIDCWEDGVKKSLVGCSGTFTMEGEDGGRVMFNFEFMGRWVAPTDEAMPAWVPSTAAAMRLQSTTFTLGTVAVKVSKIGLAMQANVVVRGDIAAAGAIGYYIITDIDPIFTCDPELELIATYDFHGIWLAGTEGAVNLVLGDGTTGVTIALAKVQARELKESDREGMQILDYTGQCNHDTGGNNSVIITAAAAA